MVANRIYDKMLVLDGSLWVCHRLRDSLLIKIWNS